MTQQEIVNRIVKLEGEIAVLEREIVAVKLSTRLVTTEKFVAQKARKLEMLQDELDQLKKMQNPTSGNEGM